MRSAFPVRINEIERIDEDARALALKPLRTVTFREILDDVAQDVPPPASVLDVGSAHGWFMEEAERRGYVATGIEPDATMAARSRVNVIRGFFPEAAQGPYDLVTFNDVFEHLPEPSRMMRATDVAKGTSLAASVLLLGRNP
jgi:2-polyprenyl-3-methyl-5-hydroxy-6-metoxy-1,4-benzoquinol methylase